MFPNLESEALDTDDFKNLSGVIDAVYNPLRSRLVQKALDKGLAAEGGLYMLVAQAAFACEKFIDTKIPTQKIKDIFSSLERQKESIVLVGMPGSGKPQSAKSLQGSFAANLSTPTTL